jgi:hypothetical protein
LVAQIAAEIAAEIGHDGSLPLDDDEPPKLKPGLLPDKQVAQRYGVSVRTVERWDREVGLNFPKPTYIRRRRYRNSAALDQWDKDNARRVANPSPQRRALAQALPRVGRGRFAEASRSAEVAPPRLAGITAGAKANDDEQDGAARPQQTDDAPAQKRT